MSKYEDLISSKQKLDINSILIEGEKVIWSGIPKKSAFIMNKVVTMLPFALLWLAFDSFFIIAMFSTEGSSEMLGFAIPFFAFHLMPVWIWLGNVLSAKKRWENTQYAVTDKRIIIQSGFIGINYQTIYYKEIKNVHLRVGIIDKLLGVGDIYFDTSISVMGMSIPNSNNANNMGNPQAFLDIENAYELYPKLQKIVLDIQTDIEYPNDLRPEENKGYNTKYNGKI